MPTINVTVPNNLVPLIVRYTHRVHVAVDGLLGFIILIQPFLQANYSGWVAAGLPEHSAIAVLGGLVIASNVLRKLAAGLEAVDGSSKSP